LLSTLHRINTVSRLRENKQAVYLIQILRDAIPSIWTFIWWM
jgi:hypothetical protein